MLTSKEPAALAGVSRATVSKCLNNGSLIKMYIRYTFLTRIRKSRCGLKNVFPFLNNGLSDLMDTDVKIEFILMQKTSKHRCLYKCIFRLQFVIRMRQKCGMHFVIN